MTIGIFQRAATRAANRHAKNERQIHDPNLKKSQALNKELSAAAPKVTKTASNKSKESLPPEQDLLRKLMKKGTKDVLTDAEKVKLVMGSACPPVREL